MIRTRLALKGEGFSILTESHVGGLLGPEAGSERQYLFMGAWESTSQRDLGSQLQAAVHFPCNVVVQETGSSAIVAALDPAEAAEEATPGDTVIRARAALTRVLERVQEPL